MEEISPADRYSAGPINLRDPAIVQASERLAAYLSAQHYIHRSKGVPAQEAYVDDLALAIVDRRPEKHAKAKWNDCQQVHCG